MATFILSVFETTGPMKRPENLHELRFLGQRQLISCTLAEAKNWLSDLITSGHIHAERFYRLESIDCTAELRNEFTLNLAFYLFPDRRLCPVRIWSSSQRTSGSCHDTGNHPEWTVDFEGVPGWSFIAAVEPRWQRIRKVPPESPWIGRSWRDWQKRDCWQINDFVSALQESGAYPSANGIYQRWDRPALRCHT